jgi:hypothetical protein
METLQHVYTPELVTERKISLTSRFLTWCQAQEENRLLWLGIILFGHGCVITPLTLFSIMLAGNPVILWPFAIAAMTMSLVVNLAAMPTKITIPIFLFSLVIDLLVIINCIAIGFSVIS